MEKEARGYRRPSPGSQIWAEVALSQARACALTPRKSRGLDASRPLAQFSLFNIPSLCRARSALWGHGEHTSSLLLPAALQKSDTPGPPSTPSSRQPPATPSVYAGVPGSPALRTRLVKVPLRGATALGAREPAQTGGCPRPLLETPPHPSAGGSVTLSWSGSVVCVALVHNENAEPLVQK